MWRRKKSRATQSLQVVLVVCAVGTSEAEHENEGENKIRFSTKSADKENVPPVPHSQISDSFL